MSSIELFISWSIGIILIIMFLYATYYFRKSEQKIYDKIVADRVDTLKILRQLKGDILKKNDEIRESKLDNAAGVGSAAGVRVGLIMGVDIVNSYIRKLDDTENDEVTVETNVMQMYKPNKNKHIYDFDTVSFAGRRALFPNF